MSTGRLGASVAVLIATSAGSADAQRADSAAQRPRADTAGSLVCPRAGAMMQLWAGPSGDSAARARASGVASGAALDRRRIDTLVTLDIADRTWQRDSLTAGVALGVAGSAGARRAPWRACVGATATFGRITASLHNVHGQIHLKADPAALDTIGGTTGRTTPPAPPRR